MFNVNLINKNKDDNNNKVSAVKTVAVRFVRQLICVQPQRRSRDFYSMNN